MGEGFNTLNTEICPGIRYRLSASALILEGSGKYAALVSIRFLDARGDVIDTGADVFVRSDVFGFYRYLGTPGQKGRIRDYIEFVAPADVAGVEIALHAWKGARVQPLDPVTLTPATPQDAEAEADFLIANDILGTSVVDVIAGESYDIHVQLATRQKVEARSYLAAFRFFDADGGRIGAPDWISVSARVGSYCYLTPAPDASTVPGEVSVIASVVVPLGAQRMQVRIVRWNTLLICTVTGLRIECLGDADRLVTTGSADLREGSWYVLRGRIGAAAGRGHTLGNLSFTFHGQDGTAILKTAENLTRTPRALNQAILTLPADNRRRADGDIDVAVGFRPPGGTTRVSWRLWPETQGWQLRRTAPFTLDTFSPDPLVCLSALQKPARHVTGLAPPQTIEIRTRLPQNAPVWNATGLGRLRLIAEWLLPHGENSWMRLGGTVDGLEQGQTARVFMVPFYFDADLQPLTAVPLGCNNDPDIGLYRQPVLQSPDGNDNSGAHFGEDLRAPEGAAFLACYLLAPGDLENLTCATLTTSAITTDEVGACADIATMSRTQLLSAAAIEEATWNPIRRRDVNMALSMLDPKVATYANRAASLKDHTTELDPAWLPYLPPRPAYDPDPSAILHLLKVIYPDESSGGAVRSTSILEAQAAQGLKPVACLPLASPAQDRQDPDTPALPPAPVPDGILERQQNGVSINTLHFPGMNAARISPAEVLEFETGQHAHVARRHRCGLIHAASGFRGYENALKGLALARCYDLPFVYEVRSFHEHTWRPVTRTDFGGQLTRLRTAQEDRCMRDADVVVTISEAMVANLAARGIAKDKLFFVPNAISQDFTTLPDPDRIETLRARLGITGKTAIGYISNFSEREGHAVLLAAFAALIRDGHDMVLVLPGDGPEQGEIARQAHRLGLTDRVVLPGNVDHREIKIWYGMLDLFVVPRIADFASDYVTPLKPYEAMSQGVPVLMSDRPVAREIAGADGSRADLFPTADSGALAALIVARLADPEALAQRSDAARQWVLKERVWSRVARRFDAIYDAARQIHAQRRAGKIHADPRMGGQS